MRTTQILRYRQLLDEILAEHTGQAIEKIREDTDRDFIMTAEQAKDYGIIDQVISSRKAQAELASLGAKASSPEEALSLVVGNGSPGDSGDGGPTT